MTVTISDPIWECLLESQNEKDSKINGIDDPENKVELIILHYLLDNHKDLYEKHFPLEDLVK